MSNAPVLRALRRRWRRPAMNVSLGIPVLATFLALLSLDDAPNGEIEGFLALRNALPVNDSWHYAMGFEAAPDRDPMAVGRYRIRAYEAALGADTSPEAGPPLVDPYEFEKYDLLDGPLFCKLQEDGCLAALKAAGPEGDALLRQHALLLRRYHTLLALPEGRPDSVIYVAPQGPAFPVRAVLRASRLHSLAALEAERKGDVGRALGMLYPHIALLRQHMADTDDLIARIVYQMQVGETLQVIALIGARHPALRLTAVPPLTPRERDLSLPLAREYQMAEGHLRHFERHPDAIMGLGPVSGLFVRFYYKPQMTLNAVYQSVGASATASLRGPEEFARATPVWEPPPLPAWFRVRNLQGADWLDLRDYSFRFLLGRMHDLDVRIALFNAVARREGARVDWSQAKNPYYADGRPPVVTPDGKEACFDGPLPDQFRLRCLAL